jgi:DNA-binding GntR family transcriptional regulator
MSSTTDTPNGEPGRDALVDQIAAAIRRRIMSGEITIGAQLRQAELAHELGVSRTPVREALRQLQTSGLIEVVPNRGAVVRVPAPWEVREAYEVRAELEGLACERAVSQINDAEVQQLRDVNRGMREALVAGDATEARAQMGRHVISAGEQLARWYERRSSTVFVG